MAGKRGCVGSTAARQGVIAESFYPAIESVRLRSRRGHKIRVISTQIEFLGGTPRHVHACLKSAPRRAQIIVDIIGIELLRVVFGRISVIAVLRPSRHLREAIWSPNSRLVLDCDDLYSSAAEHA